ncbi:Catechol dioxygenase N terminus, partial [Quadrisphaera granulorum]
MSPSVSPSASPAEVSDEQRAREEELVELVVASFDGAPDERLRHLLQALVRHLHAFVRDVRLTEAEWGAAIAFLTRVGHTTSENRQEFVLLSDVLGLSMQTVAVRTSASRCDHAARMRLERGRFSQRYRSQHPTI